MSPLGVCQPCRLENPVHIDVAIAGDGEGGGAGGLFSPQNPPPAPPACDGVEHAHVFGPHAGTLFGPPGDRGNKWGFCAKPRKNRKSAQILAEASFKPHEGRVFEGGKQTIRVCSKWPVLTVQRMEKRKIGGPGFSRVEL